MKILVVDDEKMIRNWLIMLLDQVSVPEGVEAFSASNVDDALELCKSHRFHLVITDITMPQRSGLELLRILRDDYPEISTAVLSAYDDYSYVRSAMQLGAMDYILKSEMQLSDIQMLLNKVALFPQSSDCSSEQLSLQNVQADDLTGFLHNDDLTAEQISACFPNANPENMICSVFYIALEGDIGLDHIFDICRKTLSGENIVGDILHKENLIAMVYTPPSTVQEHQLEIQRKIELLLERNISVLTDITVSGIRSALCRGYAELQEQLKKCIHALQTDDYYSTYGDDGAGISHITSRELSTLANNIRFLIRNRRYNDAAIALKGFVEDSHSRHISPGELKATVFHCLTILFVQSNQSQSDATFIGQYQDAYRRINSVKTDSELMHTLHELLENYCVHISSNVQKMHPSIDKAIAYIDQNYMHHLTLDDVAKYTFLNKAYISQLFIKNLEVSFSEYLENVRLYKAQELLRNTNASVSYIAEAVGYSSQSYFTKVFKKKTGMVPLKYRMSNNADPGETSP